MPADQRHAPQEMQSSMPASATSPHPPPPLPNAGPRRRVSDRGHAGDTIFKSLCKLAALSVILLACALLCVLIWKSLLAIRTVGIDFLINMRWDPVPDENHRKFGALAFIYGTVATSAIAMLIAVPLGVGTAAFLSEIASGWLRRVATFFVEMLAAIPSVVYGFWGITVLAPHLHQVFYKLSGATGGLGILAAGLILAIMIVPYVTAVSYDVCQAVPRSQREGSLALGASRWQTIWSVVLPYARPGIIGGCFLALGRALGETMAVTMLIGNMPQISLSPFSLGDSIASAIANQYAEATYPLYSSALVELGLLLLLVTVVVNSLARLLIWQVGRPRKPRRSLTKLVANAKTAAENPVQDQLLPSAKLRNPRFQHVINNLMTSVLGFCLVITLGTLFLILGYLFYNGIGALSWDFFVKLPAAPGEPGGGMANALIGSAMLVSMATVSAVPVGLLAAIYLAEYRSGWLGSSVRFIGELLAGVPSIVIGIFAYVVLVVPTHLFGWSGSFALCVMMIPIVMRASEEALKLVPVTLRDASYALGAKQWQTVVRVCVPAALPAIITGVFLAIARIAGETAPLLLTAGDDRFWPRSLLNDNTPSLPVYVFNYARRRDPTDVQQAWAAAFVLLAIVMLLNFGIRFLTGKRQVLASRAD